MIPIPVSVKPGADPWWFQWRPPCFNEYYHGRPPCFNEYHHGVSSFYTQITREYSQFRRPSFTEYRPKRKKKYERVSFETALLVIFAHILPLNTTNFYALGLKKICAIRHISHIRLFYIHGETIIGDLVATQWGLITD